MWANIQCDKQQLALGIMYRPPSSNHAYLKSMLDQIDNVYSYNENVMLMGDLNYDYKLDESLSSNPLHQIEILYGMRQLINSPTRVTLTTSTIIDVMFSTEHESHVVTGVYDISLSDHYMTLAGYPASLETLSPGLSPPPSLVPLSPISYSSLPSTLPPSDYPASLRITAFPRYFLNLEA